jgi:heme O synthase-like polyprenyltransferase
MGLQEQLILGVVFVAVALLVLPLIGIPRAARRLRTKRRSTRAVVASTCATALLAAGTATGVVKPLFGVLGLVLNVTWLCVAVAANRRAGRRA